MLRCALLWRDVGGGEADGLTGSFEWFWLPSIPDRHSLAARVGAALEAAGGDRDAVEAGVQFLDGDLVAERGEIVGKIGGGRACSRS